MKLYSALLVCLFSLSFSQNATAADLVRPADQQALEEYASKIDDEFSYRARIDREGKQWAQELMLMYKWPLQYPKNPFAVFSSPEGKTALSHRLQAEFAWLTVTGQGMVATYDFRHADTTLLGSTSRFVKSLMVSASFWTEVRNQCIEIAELKRKLAGTAVGDVNIKGCAETLKRDIEISQVLGSNVSLFIGGGIVIGLGKKLFTRYASKWVATRVVPLIPAFARTKVALGVLTAGIVIIPTGLIVASVSNEHETNKVFLENLQVSLDENNNEATKASVMRQNALITERRVLEFSAWAGPRIPKAQSSSQEYERLSKNFIIDVKFTGPHFSKLIDQETELEARRTSLEQELGGIPGISAKLLAIAEERKHHALSEADTKLLRSAQYLASLRLTLKIIVAAKQP